MGDDVTEIGRLYHIPESKVPDFLDMLRTNGFRVYPGMRTELIRPDFAGPSPGELEVWHRGRRLTVYTEERGKPLQDFMERYMAAQISADPKPEATCPTSRPVVIESQE